MLDYFAYLSPGAQIALGFGAFALIACIGVFIEERRDLRDLRAQIDADGNLSPAPKADRGKDFIDRYFPRGMNQ